MIPSVNITRTNGGLGATPPASGKPPVIVGPCGGGTANVPVTSARTSELVSTLVSGPSLELAALFIEKYGTPVTVIPTGTTTAGACGTVVQTGTGTSVATLDNAATANDDYEVLVTITKDGTVGTTGITLTYSLDGGRTTSSTVSLGTANTYTVPGSGGAKINFGTGTLKAGDTIAFPTTAPCWNTSDLTAALAALKNWAGSYEGFVVVGPCTAAAHAAIVTALDAMKGLNKYRYAIASTRIPNVGESESSYKTALDGIFGSLSDDRIMVCAGAAKVSSPISGRMYRRPASFVIAPRQMTVTEEINIADVDLGSLPSCRIRDTNGNPDEHDETINPGLDDSRFAVLRSWDAIQGVYVNRPRILSADGSDYTVMPYVRVMNIALEALYAYFVRRLAKPIRVNPKTGFILETVARDIEIGANAAIRAVLGAGPKASAWTVAVSRTDNLLSTKTLTGTFKLVPLAYAETITLTAGFSNPALLTT